MLIRCYAIANYTPCLSICHLNIGIHNYTDPPFKRSTQERDAHLCGNDIQHLRYCSSKTLVMDKINQVACLCNVHTVQYMQSGGQVFSWLTVHCTFGIIWCIRGPVGGFRKSKSCQKHLQLLTGLQNYVLLTVRTEKNMKN